MKNRSLRLSKRAKLFTANACALDGVHSVVPVPCVFQSFTQSCSFELFLFKEVLKYRVPTPHPYSLRFQLPLCNFLQLRALCSLTL